jgi:hypothetical protein
MFNIGCMHDLLLQLRNVKKSTWALSVLTVVALSFSIHRMAGGGSNPTDYFTADALFDKWRSAENAETALVSIEKLLNDHKELHGKYDAKIAQHLLSIGRAGTAESYASSVIKRNQTLDPCFLQFGKTSLLVAKEDYSLALEESKRLSEVLEQSSSSLLRTCNLVRIAFLEGKVGTPQAELKAWDSVLQSEGFIQFEPTVRVEGLSIKDFIEHRRQLMLL